MILKEYKYSKQDSQWEKTEAIVVGDASSLSQAVDQLAEANPGKLVFGSAVNDEVVYVGLLE